MRLTVLLIFLTSLAHALDDDGVARLQRVLEASIKAANPPGIVLWAEHRGEKLQLVKGKRAVKPKSEDMTADTIFDAASLTKVVATTPSVMLLIERGKINPEAKAKAYVPEFSDERILVKHLLTHTSGLPAGIPKDTAHPDWNGYDEGIKHGCALKAEWEPGTAFRYSDVNFITLGEIVHRVSGKTLDVFAREEVFTPLKMKDTQFNPSTALRSRIAPTEPDASGKMLRGVVHDPTSRRMGGVAGHAGLFTTAADLARYARLLMRGDVDGVKLFKPETLQLMRTSQTTIKEQRSFGFDMETRYSRPRGLMFPVGSFGHTGFTGTALWIDPASESFYIFLSSRLHPDGKGNVRELYEDVGTLVAKAIADVKWTNAKATVEAEPVLVIPGVLNGIDVLKTDHFTQLKGMRLGLITNHTGIDADRYATLDLLDRAPNVNLVKLFSPEHGIRGELDQEKISDSIDAKTQLPVISLYNDKQRVPKPEHLKNIDALVFDIQDIGTRFYTYIATLKGCLEVAAKAGKEFIVLDRINPLRSDVVEGPAVPSEIKFTACHPIAVRHGMTAGELAKMFNAELKLNAKLRIIEVQGWHRDQWFDASALPWRNPSPNMRSLTAATLYPGIGLLEYAISVGRGTETPFEVIGAPFVDDRVLAAELNKLGLPGVRFVPERFKPTASVFKDQDCGGVRIIVTNRDQIHATEIGLAIGHTLHRLYAKDFDLKKFNTLLNHDPTIEMLKAGKAWQDIAKVWQSEAQAFEERRKVFLIY